MICGYLTSKFTILTHLTLYVLMQNASLVDCFNERLKSYILFSTALPNITKQPVSVSINTRKLNIVTLYCLAIGMSPIYYQWERYHMSSNSWIRPSHRAVSITSPNLNFSVITEEDEGVYRCVVTNDDGSVISDNATISVYG